MNRYNPIIISYLMLIIFSCDKSENEGSGYIYQSWEVTDFMSLESFTYPKDNNYNPVIEFKKDGSYLLKLDRNSCSGSFNLKNEYDISISASGCTKICCDSEFSKKFASILPRVTDYSIEGNKLKLNISGWGWINLVSNN